MTFSDDFTIKSMDDLMSLIDEVGFVPFFANGIEGFSIEEHIAPGCWYDDAEDSFWPAWEWTGPVIKKMKCGYGKFLQGKAMYISGKWFPDFANFRRDGYDFDARFDDELASHYDKELYGKYSAVAQDFEQDTYDGLKSGIEHLKQYKRFIMVQNEAKEPYERFYGLKRFCQEFDFECKYLNSIENRRIHEGDVFILVNDRDLVTIIKQAAKQDLTPGKDFGIISYNETPLKEVLCGGITTLSTDFRQMGKTMASLLGMPGIEAIRNPWRLNIRSSI